MSSPRDEISHIMIGMSYDLVEECHEEMLHDNMELSLLMVNAQQINEIRVR